MKTLKKLFSSVLALILVLNIGVPALAATYGVDVAITAAADKSSYSVGDTVYVTFTQDVELTGVSGYELAVAYDHEALQWLQEESVNGAGASQISYQEVVDNAGRHMIRLDGVDISSTFSINSGAVSKLAFKVLKTGDTQLNCTIGIMDADFNLYDGASITESVVISVPDAPPVVTNGYTLTAAADKTANVGENVSVAFTVGNSDTEVTVYNAYDLSFTYDSNKLTYVSAAAADPDASITQSEGAIRVIGYGESKALGTAVVTLNFTTKAAGEAHVKATAASIDNSANAPGRNTPAATLMDDTTVIDVEEKFKVTLGDGLTAGTLIAERGQDYSFNATDYENYDYVVKATINGSSVTVTDNGNGTYTIPGTDITGPITITATMTGKEQPVTVEGTGAADVTYNSKAYYGTNYTFTVNKAAGYRYEVAASVDDTPVTLTKNDDGSYTIPGTAITGSVTVTVTKTADVEEGKNVTVTKPDWVGGAETAVKGTDYSFTIITEPGYTYGEPSVTVGDKPVTFTKNDDGSYTIAGDDITGDIFINVTRTSSTVIAVSEYITLNEKSMYLITASNVTGEGNIAKYAGNNMYWSPLYKAYAWLVVSDNDFTEMETEATNNVTVAAGTAAATIDYTGDVNMTGKTDVNDAQLTYDMYKALYESFETVSMEKFLRADVNGSCKVDTSDAANIVNVIKNA